MVEAAGVELDWGLRLLAHDSRVLARFRRCAAVASNGPPPETRDVAGYRGPFRGAHGEAAGTRSGGNVLRRLHGEKGGRGNPFPIGYL